MDQDQSLEGVPLRQPTEDAEFDEVVEADESHADFDAEEQNPKEHTE